MVLKNESISVVAAIIIFAASLAVFYLDPLGLEVLLYKILLLLVGSFIAFFIFINSEKGTYFRNFITQTKIELKKVVWPNKNNTVRTTIIVVVAVVIIAIFLWIIDAFWTLVVELLMGW